MSKRLKAPTMVEFIKQMSETAGSRMSMPIKKIELQNELLTIEKYALFLQTKLHIGLFVPAAEQKRWFKGFSIVKGSYLYHDGQKWGDLDDLFSYIKTVEMLITSTPNLILTETKAKELGII